MRIAILLTCFNRKEKTVKCLECALAQRGIQQLMLDFFITDDGSSDGTSEAIAKGCAGAHILNGNGSLYWNGGMRLAWSEAMKVDPDFYLWLNDDTFLYPDALHDMLDTYLRIREKTGRCGIVVGSTEDESGNLTYGGLRRRNGWHRLKMDRLIPNADIQRCETFNGNSILISRDVTNVLGNLSPEFVHAMGDIDYGLRAVAAEIPMFVMPYYAARCINDHPGGKTQDQHPPSLAQRLRKTLSPKELPWRAWLTLCRRHTGILWPFYWIWPYAKAFFILRSDKLSVKHRAGAP